MYEYSSKESLLCTFKTKFELWKKLYEKVLKFTTKITSFSYFCELAYFAYPFLCNLRFLWQFIDYYTQWKAEQTKNWNFRLNMYVTVET
jgi:hypothetical protein